MMSGKELTGLDIVIAAKDGTNVPPYMQKLGMQFDDVSFSRVTLTMLPGSHLSNGNGQVHSGALSSIMDAAGGLAARTILESGKTYFVTDLKARFFRDAAISDRPLEAIAEVCEKSESLIETRVDLFDAAGRKIAKANLGSQVLDLMEKPVIAQDVLGAPERFDGMGVVSDTSFVATLGLGFDQEMITLFPDKNQCNSVGTMHGGVMLSCLQVASDVMASKTVRDGQEATLRTINAHYLRPVRPIDEQVQASASVIRPGRTSIVMASALKNSDGKEVASAQLGYEVSLID